nr:MAG TPA: hypothetical protein [Caudoviricetes sp.]
MGAILSKAFLGRSQNNGNIFIGSVNCICSVSDPRKMWSQIIHMLL